MLLRPLSCGRSTAWSSFSKGNTPSNPQTEGAPPTFFRGGVLYTKHTKTFPLVVLKLDQLIVAFVDDIKIKDAGTIGSASDPDAIAIGADGDVTLTQDLELQHDGATISFGGNDEIVLTHVHDTGLKLTDTGGSPTLQLHDASEAISSDGSKLILTSNGVAFNMPTADGDAGQLIKTNGSGTLSFVSSTGSINPATTLSTSTDCGSVGGAETTDAFGQVISDDIIILNLLVDATDQLGIADQGALT